MISSRSSLASFSREKSCGNRIFEGAQVASRIRVPSLSGFSSASVLSAFPAGEPEEGSDGSGFGSTGAAGRMVLVVGVLLFVLRLFLSLFRFGFALFQKLFVHEDGHVDIEPLPEGHQRGRIKRRNLLISRQADEVLKIRIFRDLLYEFPVGEAELFWIIRAPRAMRQGFATFPSVLVKRDAYRDSYSSQGISCASRTHRLLGFIWRPSG